MLPQIDQQAQTALAQRRSALSRRTSGAPILVLSGRAPSRNYPANQYDFRACSHFLYLVGLPLPDAALLLLKGHATLFVPPPAEDDALWHGELPSLDELRARTGVDAVRPADELEPTLAGLPDVSRLPLPASPSAQEEALALAVIEQRLPHDPYAIRELRRAAAVTTEAHAAGMGRTRVGGTVSSVRAAMEERVLAADFTMAYPPIVTTRGEVLHSHDRTGTLAAGDLLLADVGAETDTGWASDVTRTWPVTGRFSPSQRAMYELVLAAQLAAIHEVRPGVRYRDVHLAACRTLCRGLVDEGLLSGQVDGLVERGAHALFFPHGVGHLLGLDVHDMEDLGDRAGYAPGRSRSTQFGLAYLRLDRDLQPGMAVTIEPGIYFVPAILQSPKLTAPFADCFHHERLSRFADVRGIRIEDDVLVTDTGHDVLTAAIPKSVAAIEDAVGAAVGCAVSA